MLISAYEIDMMIKALYNQTRPRFCDEKPLYPLGPTDSVMLSIKAGDHYIYH
ncbi:MAG: hypothetical protein CSYNP_02013 [Syntrophus sp. SKADARSKE-3]|nr:hypothetical protein [Syntrophus sp. SKADARSKE-3]